MPILSHLIISIPNLLSQSSNFLSIVYFSSYHVLSNYSSLLSSSMFALSSLVMHLGLVLHHVLLNYQAFCLLPMNFTKICWCHPSFTTYHLACFHFSLLTSSCGQPPLTMSTIIHWCFFFYLCTFSPPWFVSPANNHTFGHNEDSKPDRLL